MITIKPNGPTIKPNKTQNDLLPFTTFVMTLHTKYYSFFVLTKIFSIGKIIFCNNEVLLISLKRNINNKQQSTTNHEVFLSSLKALYQSDK